jgi:hypothetical protein
MPVAIPTIREEAGADELTLPTVSPATVSSVASEPKPTSSEQDSDGAAMNVLQALERGDIDVEEAIRQLDRLRGDR